MQDTDHMIPAFEKELREVKIAQALGQRPFVSDKAREDFVQLMMPRVKRTNDGYFGEDDSPLGAFIVKEYEARRGGMAPELSSKQPINQQNDVMIEDINPHMSKEDLNRAWQAVGRGLEGQLGTVICGRK